MGFVGLCLLVDAAGAALAATRADAWYLSLSQPRGVLPAAAFGPVWTVLYVLMGLAAWLVWQRVGAAWPLRLWGWQLLCNALWTPAFFGARSPAFGLAVILPLLLLVAATTATFWRIRRSAGFLMVPYAAWTVYATYLSAGVWWLN